jgi:hypothetical protein
MPVDGGVRDPLIYLTNSLDLVVTRYRLPLDEVTDQRLKAIH